MPASAEELVDDPAERDPPRRDDSRRRETETFVKGLELVASVL